MSINLNGSQSAQPDLDWSQLKETVLMINLAVSQVEQSMHEGGQSVDTLASSFTYLAQVMCDMQDQLKHLPEGNEKSRLIETTQVASNNINSAIIAFQFYDKLSQRLGHVSSDLFALTKLISDPSRLYSPPEWKKLQDMIRSQYTMEEERNMFDKVIAGMSITLALEEYKAEMAEKSKNKSDEDEIELF
ncbi:MAG: hypothetical protein HQL46_05765 [Gammaproteobacteria bacterium]|nr:hypothetical protein [Gammaproteobacteria bacterium]